MGVNKKKKQKGNGRLAGNSTTHPLILRLSFSITETLKPPNVSHKKCSRQTETWTSVSPWRLVAESHVAEDLQTQFMHPKFHVGRVIEFFARIEEVVEGTGNEKGEQRQKAEL